MNYKLVQMNHLICPRTHRLVGGDSANDPVVVARSSGVDTTVTAAIAPAGDTDEVPFAVARGVEDVWATRVTLAGIDVATDLATAHLEGGVDRGAEALLATIVGQVEHVDLHEVARDAAAAEESAPASGPTHCASPILTAIWNADWDDVVVVDDDGRSGLHQGNVVSEGGRAVLRVHDQALNSHGLNPCLYAETIVTTDIEHVGVDVGRAEDAVSSSDDPADVDERRTADEGTVANHGSHVAVIAWYGLMATDHLLLASRLQWSETATWRVNGRA